MRIDFTLAAAQRLFLVVRGPAPSCRTVGVVPFRGRAGENTVRFAGRIGGRPLDPGVYLLTLSPTRRADPDAESDAVRVVSPLRTVPLPDSAPRPSCSEVATSQPDAAAHLLRDEEAAGAAAERRSESTPSERPAAPLRPPVNVPPPAAVPRGFPPALSTDSATSAIELLVTFGVFALIGGVLFVLLALVTRFLGGARSA